MVELLTLLAGGALLVGLLGIIVPILPGSILIAAGLAVWAIAVPSWPARIIVAVGLIALLLANIGQYLIAGRHLKKSGVPNRSLLIGAVLGLVGFFVIPVVGLPIGFTAGIWLSESQRIGFGQQARSSTIAAVKAVALSVGIELLGGLIAAASWIAAVVVAWPHLQFHLVD